MIDDYLNGYQRDVYRQALKDAAQASGQQYNGSHGLRWNYAQSRMAEERAKGTYERDALSMVSRELGHFREDITLHYLTTG